VNEGGNLAGRLCPWWIGYLLACPLRSFFENPQDILGDYVKPGMTILDLGCAMGFFSLWMAGKVGQKGKIIAVDVQGKMIKSLKRRAARRGFSARIDARICSTKSLEIDDLAERVDFAIAFHVAHEITDVRGLMTEIYAALRPGANFYLIEPKGHVSAEDFAVTVDKAQKAGFAIVDHPVFKRSRTIMLTKA
jgi:ubiquinone/menaquinone biosynthesis C-methylase UbiE